MQANFLLLNGSRKPVRVAGQVIPAQGCGEVMLEADALVRLLKRRPSVMACVETGSQNQRVAVKQVARCSHVAIA